MTQQSARDKAISAYTSTIRYDDKFDARIEGYSAGYADGGNASTPQDAILFCPKCKEQHIDEANPDKCKDCGHAEAEHFGHNGDDLDDIGCYGCGGIGCMFNPWLNLPHKKHRCHGCNDVFKPLNIPTNGVSELIEPYTEKQDAN